MSLEVAKSAIKTLTDKFNRQFTQEGIKGIWKELIAQPDAAIEAATDQIYLTCNYLPSPAQLLEKVKVEAKKLANQASADREKEWADYKGGNSRREQDRQPTIFSREQSTKHGKFASQALFLMMSDASREDKIECFRKMDDLFPGIGWAQEGMSLQKMWGMGP